MFIRGCNYKIFALLGNTYASREQKFECKFAAEMGLPKLLKLKGFKNLQKIAG